MEKSIEIKITFETIMKNFGSIHSFEKLRSKIKEKYNLNLGQSHYLVYIDDDGDEITISNQDDLDIAIYNSKKYLKVALKKLVEKNSIFSLNEINPTESNTEALYCGKISTKAQQYNVYPNEKLNIDIMIENTGNRPWKSDTKISFISSGMLKNSIPIGSIGVNCKSWLKIPIITKNSSIEMLQLMNDKPFGNILTINIALSPLIRIPQINKEAIYKNIDELRLYDAKKRLSIPDYMILNFATLINIYSRCNLIIVFEVLKKCSNEFIDALKALFKINLKKNISMTGTIL